MRRIISGVMFIISLNMINAQQNIRNLRWQNMDAEITEAHTLDCVTIHADVENIENGEEVAVSIWVKGEENDDFLGEYVSRVLDNQINFYWIIQYDETLQNSYEDLKKNGFTIPQYYFAMRYGTRGSRMSSLLTIKEWSIRQTVYEHTHEPIINKKYTLILPDKTMRQGWSDAEGYIREFNLPMGECYFYFHEETGEVHEAEPAIQLPEKPLFYRVKENDSLWKIAGYDYIYGNSRLWERLYEANKHNFIDEKDPNLIEIEQALIIPSVAGEIRSGIRN
jgi:nucleoid-associated protein YgaU